MHTKLLQVPGMLLLGFTLTQTLALAQFATLVKDINTAATVASSNPSFHSAGAFIYFPATNPTVGTELYKTLGSSGVPTLIRDINPGPGNAFPGSLHTIATTTYFAASDGTNGTELWTSDGTKHSLSTPAARGSPANPMRDEEIEDKLRTIAAGWRADYDAGPLIEAVWTLERSAGVSDLLALTAVPG